MKYIGIFMSLNLSKDQEADLISFKFGKDNHQEPAMVGTDIFDVSVLYESFEMYKRQPVLSYLDE